jgi:tetratricopeptide (TPR) repeat protein
MRENDIEHAYSNYRLCLPYFRDSPYFWCGLAHVYYHTQQGQDAVIAFQRALFLKNDIAGAWLNIGLISEENSDFAGAMKIYQTGKVHCAEEAAFDERMETLKTQRAGHRKYGVGNSLAQIDESRAVVAPPEQFAANYVRSVPRLPASAIGLRGAEAAASIGELASLPASLFQ